MKLWFKKRIYIFLYRLFAVYDVLFSERFELKTFRNGMCTSRTRFYKKEILNAKQL